MKKKIMAVILACALVAGTAAGSAGTVTVRAEEGQENVTEDGFRYEDSGNGIEITSYDGSATEIIIPNEINGKTVTGIGDYAFYDCSSLTSVSIPKGVTSIGESAFSGCDGLKDVYYAGSRVQWEKIEIASNNGHLLTAAIRYGSSDSGNTGTGASSVSITGTSKKPPQSVTTTDIKKTYGAKPFSLGAKSSGNGALSYAVSDPKIATVDASGKVTIKGCGITEVTITTAETSAYAKAQKVIKLTVKPKKMTVSSVKFKKRKIVMVKWKKDKTTSGYLIERATDKKFKKNKTVSATVKKLKPDKKYYVRICAYAKSGKTKVQGDWSKPKTVKVKK